MMRARILIPALAALALAPSLPADRPAGEDSPAGTASFSQDTYTYRPGEPLWILIRLKLDEGWHTYWENPGDNGMPARWNWNLPDGFDVVEMRFPVPTRFGEPPSISFGYDGTPSVYAKIQTSVQATNDCDLALDLNWLVCKESCIPVHSRLAAVLQPSPPGNHRPVEPSPLPPLLDGAMAYVEPDGSCVLTGPPGAGIAPGSTPYFYPRIFPFIDPSGAQTLSLGDRGWILRLPASPYRTALPAGISGLLVVDSPTSAVWRVECPLIKKEK